VWLSELCITSRWSTQLDAWAYRPTVGVWTAHCFRAAVMDQILVEKLTIVSISNTPRPRAFDAPLILTVLSSRLYNQRRRRCLWKGGGSVANITALPRSSYMHLADALVYFFLFLLVTSVFVNATKNLLDPMRSKVMPAPGLQIYLRPPVTLTSWPRSWTFYVLTVYTTWTTCANFHQNRSQDIVITSLVTKSTFRLRPFTRLLSSSSATA